MAVGLDIGPNEEVCGVRTHFGITFKCKAAVLTTGTFMNGIIWVGRQSLPAGRCERGVEAWGVLRGWSQKGAGLGGQATELDAVS